MTTRVDSNDRQGEEKDEEKDSVAPPSAAALRALAEARERRRAAAQAPTPEEIGGRGGLDPIRYGDWEAKGLTSDF